MESLTTGFVTSLLVLYSDCLCLFCGFNVDDGVCDDNSIRSFWLSRAGISGDLEVARSREAQTDEDAISGVVDENVEVVFGSIVVDGDRLIW